MTNTPTCPTCGKNFTKNSNRQIYCSFECRYPLKKDKQVNKQRISRGARHCRICGTLFAPSTDNRFYCSDKCQLRRKKNHDKICLLCKKEFFVPYHQRNKKSCSRECIIALLSIKNKSSEKTIIKKICKHCKKEFKAPLERKHQVYCSKNCRSTGIPESKRKEDTITRHSSYTNQYGTTRKHRAIIEEYIGRKLLSNEIVHHIDGNTENNDIKNLYICLSISEHIKIHSKLKNKKL